MKVHYQNEDNKKLHCFSKYMNDEEKSNYIKLQKLSSPTRIEVLCLETGIIYSSIRQLALDINVSRTKIMNSIKANKSINGLTYKLIFKEDKNGKSLCK